MQLLAERQLRLETFQACWCDWFDDSSLMRLLQYQIDAFDGRLLLKRLDIDICFISWTTFISYKVERNEPCAANDYYFYG